MEKMTEQEFCQKCVDIDEDKGDWIGIAIIFALFGFMVGIAIGCLVGSL